ncbi:MAG: hypothetical protein H0T41_08040 [Rhodobacteraceae bacterium]|nr:hypothetical protein [Paracoccaceae bacterium]
MSASGADWRYGQIHMEQRERCDCGAPVYEVGACDECGTPWLLAELAREGAHERLGQAAQGEQEDEYILDVEPEEEGGAAATPTRSVLIGPAAEGDAPLAVRITDAALLTRPGSDERVARVRMVERPEDRGCCERSHQRAVSVRPQRFGAPFLMGAAMPVLLEATRPSADPAGKPSGGRRLLSFTDSRQGTARFSAKLQQDAERTLTRAVIYHAVQEAGQGDQDTATGLREEIAALETVAKNPVIGSILAAKRRELALAEGGAGVVAWAELRAGLAMNAELAAFAGDVWRDRPRGGRQLAEYPVRLAELFLLRELFRRPRMQNNLETMGLARLVFPALEERARLGVPAVLAEAGLDADAWSGVLHAAVDILFRATLAVDLPVDPVDMRHWITPRSALSEVLEPGTPPDSETSTKSPSGFHRQRAPAAFCISRSG